MVERQASLWTTPCARLLAGNHGTRYDRVFARTLQLSMLTAEQMYHLWSGALPQGRVGAQWPTGIWSTSQHADPTRRYQWCGVTTTNFEAASFVRKVITLRSFKGVEQVEVDEIRRLSSP